VAVSYSIVTVLPEAGEKSGFDFGTCSRAGNIMYEAGFVNIVWIPYKWLINEWPREPK
jgi:hypothetical protein